jgi:hypothetical protein
MHVTGFEAAAVARPAQADGGSATAGPCGSHGAYFFRRDRTREPSPRPATAWCREDQERITAGPPGNTPRLSIVGESMDGQTKREIWLLAIGTALVELPVAFAAFTILSH